MARRWQKAVWALMCGSALGLSACGDSGDPPGDAIAEQETPTDAADEVDAGPDLEEDPGMTYYGPAPDF